MITLQGLSTREEVVAVFLAVEIILITVLLIGSYVAKIWFVFSRHRENKQIQGIREYFFQKKINKPPPYLNNTRLILSELKQTTALTSKEKRIFVEKYLLITTRKLIASNDFWKRYYLLECYKYSISVIDISNLIKLIKDDRYIICSNAIKTSNSLIDGSVYQVIIEKLKDIDRFTRKIYILQLQKNDILIDTLNNNLISTQDISIKELCYEIIYQIGASFHFFQLAMKDVEETKGECQLAAIRVFAKSNPEKAKDTLYSLLKSQNWLIRNTVIQGISDVKTPESLEELVKCLDDNNYLVRTKAAKSLSNISDESRSLLIKYEENDSSRFQDIATYFLDIYDKRKQ